MIDYKTPQLIRGGVYLLESHLIMKSKYLIIVCVFAALVGCSIQHTTPHTTPHTIQLLNTNPIAVNLSSLSAEFTTRIYGKGDNTTTQWQLWRSAERVEWLNVSANTSELWTKTSQNLWFYSKVFHADQHIIEYSPVDLHLLQVAPAWQSFAAALDPTLLQKLPNARKIKPLDGFQRIQYRGSLDGTAYEIDWLPELSLATRVKTVEEGLTRVTELKRPLVIADNSQSPQNTSRYRVIEYADLGDMERDPFVMKVQHSLLGTQAHFH